MNASLRNQEYFLQQLEDVERLVSNKERELSGTADMVKYLRLQVNEAHLEQQSKRTRNAVLQAASHKQRASIQTVSERCYVLKDRCRTLEDITVGEGCNQAYKRAKERVERLKQLMEEEAESTTAFLNTVHSHMQKRQRECTRAEARLQAFQTSVAQGIQQMQGKLERKFKRLIDAESSSRKQLSNLIASLKDMQHSEPAESPDGEVSSLVAAAHWLSKIGESDRKCEAERMLKRAVELKCAIGKHMEGCEPESQHEPCHKLQRSCTLDRLGTSNEEYEKDCTGEPVKDDQLSLEALSEFKNSKLWNLESDCVLPQLPSQLKLQKVAQEVSQMRITLAKAEHARAQAQAQEHRERSALEALNKSLKRKRAQINDFKFVQSLSLED